MDVEFLIVGQGISGSWLSYWLHKEDRSFLVIDKGDPTTPSRISAGVINPVTGRRHVSVWLAEEILPFAWQNYKTLGTLLGINAISEKKLIDFFPTAQMRQSFIKRTEEQCEFIRLPGDENYFRDHFNYELGYGEFDPTYTAHLETILPAWRNFLKLKNTLLEESFEKTALEFTGDEIMYKSIKASCIIFCDGNSGPEDPWFGKLPYALNKGEIIFAEIPGLPAAYIYKRSLALVPLAEKDKWWIGSNYAWEYNDLLPTNKFREETEALLKKWLRLPFTIIDHVAGLRPATIERRPFVGRHPLYPSLAILNGMGSKGCSLAPYFAKELVDHLLQGKKINSDADVTRFSRILSR